MSALPYKVTKHDDKISAELHLIIRNLIVAHSLIWCNEDTEEKWKEEIERGN